MYNMLHTIKGGCKHLHLLLADAVKLISLTYNESNLTLYFCFCLSRRDWRQQRQRANWSKFISLRSKSLHFAFTSPLTERWCSVSSVLDLKWSCDTFLKSLCCLLSDSNKPNPNQISVTNGKMATVNGVGTGAYHTAGGGRACESCYSEFVKIDHKGREHIVK